MIQFAREGDVIFFGDSTELTGGRPV